MTPDIRDEIKKILTKLAQDLESNFADSNYASTLIIGRNFLITQALTSIDSAYKKWFMKCVGED